MNIQIVRRDPYPWIVYDLDRPGDDTEVAFADSEAEAQYAAQQYQQRFA
jgi:hypothetical protein